MSENNIYSIYLISMYLKRFIIKLINYYLNEKVRHKKEKER